MGEGAIPISERTGRIAILAVVVLAAILRIYDAGSQLWYDEIRSGKSASAGGAVPAGAPHMKEKS